MENDVLFQEYSRKHEAQATKLNSSFTKLATQTDSKSLLITETALSLASNSSQTRTANKTPKRLTRSAASGIYSLAIECDVTWNSPEGYPYLCYLNNTEAEFSQFLEPSFLLPNRRQVCLEGRGLIADIC
ncbi:hypothetical protein AVEN_194774-1 [Araneus ventricosus]|uniref:Uncharacterized protein n=1 Tax=Araneus ventricosus TaxID=182803 RepID=A0A4Y2B4X5_ARAVE|nr:hypothetical protein AVEN_194774-1 [Araneus ventricosus]